jgi:hypothetical protein
MKVMFRWLLLFCGLNILIFSAAAEQPQIPANAWEQHSEGVALALMLNKGTGNDVQSTYLVLYVKNTSDHLKYLVTLSRGTGVLFFYVDGSGKQMILGNHDHPDDPAKDELESTTRRRTIPPGVIVHTGTEITADEVTLIKTHPVKCKILLDDPTTSLPAAVVGSPQLLTP